MPHAARTAPGTGGSRPRAVAVLAALAALALTLLTLFGIAGSLTGTAGEPVTGALSGHHQVHHEAGPQHADDGCDAICGHRAAPRHEPHPEHPAPRGHLVSQRAARTVLPFRLARPSPPTGRLSPSWPHTAHDHRRAPPVSSGI